MLVTKIRNNATFEVNDIEITNIYCALIVYTNILRNPIMKANSQKLLDETAVLMRELGF